MTSRKKIAAITKATNKYNCGVYLKTGRHPPGVMIAESVEEENLRDWIGSVKVSLNSGGGRSVILQPLIQGVSLCSMTGASTETICQTSLLVIWLFIY